MVLIDTCSLLQLTRYYLPFDGENILIDFFKKKFEQKEFLVLDKIYDECSRIAKGIVVKALPFLEDYKISTVEILPDRRFFNMANCNFINESVKKALTPEQFSFKINQFMESADAKLILFSLLHKNTLIPPRIVTEETETPNDAKDFKKIPALCKIMGVESITLPELLNEYSEINFGFKRV